MKRFFSLVFCLTAILFAGCQKAPSLILSGGSSLEMNANGDSQSVTFTSNRDWTATASESWVTVSPASGTASDNPISITVRASANTTYEDRSATVTIKAEGLTQTITVRQPANLGIIVPTKTYELSSDARTIEVDVQANVAYTVTISDGWIKQTGTKALTSQKLVFSVDANKTYDARSATITIKPQDPGVAEQVISVNQAQKDALLVDNTSYSIAYGGGEIEFKVNANVDFEVKSGVEWVQYVETKALRSSTVRLKVSENKTYSAREGKVTIKQKNGSLSKTVTVKQKGRVAVTEITLNKKTLSLTEGETATLKATVKPDNATDKTVTWSSDKSSVAKVDKNGKVSALVPGTATITAKAGSKTASCVVTVKDKPNLIVPTKTFEVTSDARTIEVEVQTNVAYTVKISASWIKQVQTKSLPSEKLIFEVEANKTYDARSATITLTPQVSGVATQVVSVKQAQKDAILVDNTTYTIAHGGGEIEFKVDANVDFTVKSGVEWVQYVETKALRSSTVRLKVSENKTYSAREGKVTIKQKNGSLTKTVTVKQNGLVAVTEVTLDKKTLSLTEGESTTLKATVKPDNATDKTVTWSSNKTAVAKVDKNGKVTAVAAGTATITAKAGSKSASCSVTVNDKPNLIVPTKTYEVASDARTIEVEVQTNVAYTVKISASWIKQVQTKSLPSEKLIFEVEANTTYDSRSATITLKPQVSGVAEQVVSVTQAQKDALLVEDTSYSIAFGGGEIEFKVEANVDFTVKSGVDWVQYVETKALRTSTVRLKVSENKTTSAREGKVTVKQKNGSLTKTVTVKQKGRVAVTEITLDKKTLSLMEGETATLTATVKPDNASDKTVTWSSDKTAVATVDKNGKVTAVGAGTATITAKAGSKTASCTVTVKNSETLIRETLMKLYDALDGPNWKKNNGWGTDADLNYWDGVVYYSPKDYPQEKLMLQFSDFGLKGEIPECIGDLTSLTILSLNGEPNLTGTLPKTFANLVNLESLTIYNTSLSSLPDVFGGMKNLSYVQVYYNRKMKGALPESLGNSEKITAFVVSSNLFEGTLPASWSKIADTQGFSVERNHLSGKIPSSFLNVTGEKLAHRLQYVLQQNDGYGFDISDIDIPGYWPLGTITDIDGKTFSFADIVKKNKYTVYLSWATWCPFSNILMPALKDYYETYHKDGLEIIATIWHPETGSDFSDDEKQFENEFIHKKGYDAWYNFYFGPYMYITRINHLTPVAEVCDSKGNVLFSTQYNLPDPVRKRYGTNEGDLSASADLIPFLETLLGPAETPDTYESTDYSKDGEVITLQKAKTGKGINIVFLGDAYTDKDMKSGGVYETVMKQAMEEFFAIEPYKSFRDRFNVYTVKVVSKNGHVGDGYTTALGAVFAGGTEINGNQNKCYEYAQKVPGISDTKNLLIPVLVNAKRHAGTAYLSESAQSGIGFVSSCNNDPEIFGITLRHECGGHAFGFLADEYSENNSTPDQNHIDSYTEPYTKYGWFANVDFTNDKSKVRWSKFLSNSNYKNEVGIFEGAALYSHGAWRPSENSMMRDNYEYFNAPSRWAIYQRILKLSGETCTFDNFVKYDAVNRTATKAAGVRPPLKLSDKPERGAPPVIVP